LILILKITELKMNRSVFILKKGRKGERGLRGERGLKGRKRRKRREGDLPAVENGSSD